MKGAKVNNSLLLILTGLLLLSLAACVPDKDPQPDPIIPAIAPPPNLGFVGARSSSYGINPFPSAAGWSAAITEMSRQMGGIQPAAIWLVGELGEDHRSCQLFFPGQSADKNILFMADDRHEDYLSYFDQQGIQVFLQVEPGSADVLTLMKLVVDRYGHHPCVIGFGVDVEWFRESEQPEWGVPVDDALAESWDLALRSRRADYRLFLKHWDRDWMPPHYRGQIVFVDDSQALASMNDLVEEFADYWAAHFFPSPVFFQIGYEADQIWWSQLPYPVQTLTRAIAQAVWQTCGVFWVDFTLDQVLPVR